MIIISKKLKSFDPIINENSKILILGTFPGGKSLESKQYYANPRNQFWEIIYSVYNADVLGNYDEKCQFLLDNNIAVWDVLNYVFREGSLDISIEDEVPNNIPELLEKYSNIHRIVFNGSKAEKYFKRYFRNLYNTMDCVRVSSTSPTPGKNVKSLSEKKLEWKQVIKGEKK